MEVLFEQLILSLLMLSHSSGNQQKKNSKPKVIKKKGNRKYKQKLDKVKGKEDICISVFEDFGVIFYECKDNLILNSQLNNDIIGENFIYLTELVYLKMCCL